METLEEKIGYTFRDRSLLNTALTHSSYANERKNCASYERLEFLGDSILGFVTASYLYAHIPEIPEGRMTKLRADLVCEQSLYAVAGKLGLSGEMLLGRGAERGGERHRPSILADMVEAIIAAIFLDGGLKEASRFIHIMLLDHVDLEEAHKSDDYKTALQELLQRDGDCSIRYEEVSESGPDHDKTFIFRVLINGIPSGEGSGRTKKEAEQAAASVALEKLKK